MVPRCTESGMYADMVAALEDSPPPLRTHLRLDLGRGPRLLDGLYVPIDGDTLLVTWRDVTDAVEGERLLERAYEETAEMRVTLQTALDATSDGFAVYALESDDEGQLVELRVVHANAAGAMSLGLDPFEMVGMGLHEFFPDVIGSGLWDRIVDAAVTKAPQHHRVHMFDDDGRWLSSWDNSVAPVGEERMAITWRDVSAEERALRQLAQHRDEAMHSATHDALTGLPNRILLREHLQEALRTCLPDERVGIVFVDLDRFKAINDTHGHAAGDAVLKATAERLGRVVRHGDLAARLAGDEFVLVLTQLNADWTPDLFFARASELLAEPLWAEGVELHPSASLGVVLADPRSGPTDVDALIKDADAAMYVTKAARKS
jgi:diguanylate cyclase (GGDEF)-like protein